jgi:sugar O-acyltransferase (sialic acid O-acetyltransferase NeuD family)
MKKILLLGGGGHCKSVIDVIEQEGKFEIAGIVDQPQLLGSKVLGYEVIGCDNDLKRLALQYDYALITVGHIKSSALRAKLFELAKAAEFTLPSIISPRAYVSQHATIGEGTLIMHDALINANVRVGNNCIINTKALIEHDSIIEKNCHISTGTIINGGVTVKKNSFIGSNALSKEGITIEANSFIKAGSIIT